jgi:deoxyribonucleoside regulator
MLDPTTVQDRRALLVRVAELYYVEERSQQAVADQLGISRSQVSRLLSEARDIGIVEIRIHHEPPAHAALEAAVAQRFPDLGVTVVDERDRGAALRVMGDRAARIVERALKPGGTLALTHGSTVFEVVRAIRTDQLPNLRIRQMAGFEVRNPLDNGWQLIRLCVDRLGGGYRYLHAPLLVSSAELHRALMADPDNLAVMDAARAADVAVIGIGSLDPNLSSLTRAGHLTQEQLTSARERGSIGALNGYHYDLDGKLIDELNQRIVGLSPPELMGIRVRVGVAGGAEKAPGVIGAIRAGWINHLVTDAPCAERIVEMVGQQTTHAVPRP